MSSISPDESFPFRGFPGLGFDVRFIATAFLVL